MSQLPTRITVSRVERGWLKRVFYLDGMEGPVVYDARHIGVGAASNALPYLRASRSVLEIRREGWSRAHRFDFQVRAGEAMLPASIDGIIALDEWAPVSLQWLQLMVAGHLLYGEVRGQVLWCEVRSSLPVPCEGSPAEARALPLPAHLSGEEP